MLMRRVTPRLLIVFALTSTFVTLYITRDAWALRRLGLNNSRLSYSLVTNISQGEQWPLLTIEDVTSTQEEESMAGNPPTDSQELPKGAEQAKTIQHVQKTTPVASSTPALSSVPQNPTSSQSLESPKNLQELCSETSWNEGLWIQCHSNARRDSEGKRSVHGGLNNVRNRIQTCLRVAIDSGAGVIMPKVATRNQTQLKDLGGGEPVPASRFWNIDTMVKMLGDQCPKLEVRFDIERIETMFKAPRRHFSQARYEAGTFRATVLGVLKENKFEISTMSEDKPVAISFGDTFLAWDYEKSNELSTVRKDLYRTLQYNQTLLNISSKILQAPQLQNGFIGVHLRAEKDWPRSFGKVSDQMRLYIEDMESLERQQPSDLRIVYVSSGSREGIDTFRKKVEYLGYEVHDKWSLLDDLETLATVDSLMFDEKAIIEYQMLLNANYFLGPAMSSMSSLIAFTRALDGPEDFFTTFIYPGSTKHVGDDGAGFRRTYDFQSPELRGDSRSKLMVVNGDDIMSFFP